MAETEEEKICENCRFARYDFIKTVICYCEESKNYGKCLCDEETCECFLRNMEFGEVVCKKCKFDFKKINAEYHYCPICGTKVN